MRKLRPFTEDCAQEFDKIISGKRGARVPILRNIFASVVQRFQHYADSVNALDTITQSPITNTGEKEALEHCYDGNTQAVSSLKAKIKANQPTNWCQYCGLAPADSFDHYVPKSAFPEYSVLAINLIPSCPTCNNDKGTVFIGPNGREILNLYYDTLPDIRYLVCNITYFAGVPSPDYMLQTSNQIPPALWATIENHYRNLGLLQKFRECSAETISETRESLAGYSQTQAQNRLLQDEQSATQTYGINHWRTALIFALANNDQFTSSL